MKKRRKSDSFDQEIENQTIFFCGKGRKSDIFFLKKGQNIRPFLKTYRKSDPFFEKIENQTFFEKVEN